MTDVFVPSRQSSKSSAAIEELEEHTDLQMHRSRSRSDDQVAAIAGLAHAIHPAPEGIAPPKIPRKGAKSPRGGEAAKRHSLAEMAESLESMQRQRSERRSWARSVLPRCVCRQA
jgi:hypothetical protein